jgi:hypothetical protein
LLANAAPASVPDALLLTTVKAAAHVATGAAVTGVASASVAALVKGELKTMLLTKLKLVTCLLLLAAMAGFAQPDGPALQAPPAAPGAGAGAGVGAQPAEAPKQRFPVFANSKAFVQRDGETGLKLRAELPMSRFLKLMDADGKPVHIHEFVNWQPPPFTVEVKDVRVYDSRGRARDEKEWTKALTEETLVLIEFRDGAVDAKQLAEAYRLYREDLSLLVLPPAILKGLDTSKAFAPARSLPQVFPGAPGNPGVVPPPAK